jgi:phosphoenolpyruvate synthase/pyruvate phosphate dikinase
MADAKSYVRWFGDLGIEDVAEVGGKNASLGELYRELTPLGVNVPNGFAATADAYRETLTASGAWDQLRETLDGLDSMSLNPDTVVHTRKIVAEMESRVGQPALAQPVAR